LPTEALYYLWDPIGVSGVPQARDEYYAYLPRVFQLVKTGRRDELLDYLREVSDDHMGLPGINTSADEATADFLFDAAAWIQESTDSSDSAANVE
jgi:hypothetical protein